MRTMRLPKRFVQWFSLPRHELSDENRRCDSSNGQGRRFVYIRVAYLCSISEYGPATVQLDPPTVRVKCRENTTTRVTRTAEPNIHPEEKMSWTYIMS